MSLAILGVTYFQKIKNDVTGRSKTIFYIVVTLAVILQISNITAFANSSNDLTGGSNSYRIYSENILRIIPQNKTVFMSAIPDPYFVFKDNKRTNTLIEYPMIPVGKNEYLAVLSRADYVIFNSPLDSAVAGFLLQEYLKSNALKAYRIGDVNNYQAFVIELKPAQERIIPQVDNYPDWK